MVDGVTQQMGQRRLELFQDVAINLGLLAFDLQAHLLAQRAPQVTDHAALSGKHIGEGPHTAGQRGVIEQLCALAGLPAELIKVGRLLQEDLLGLPQQLLHLGQGILDFRALATGLQLDFQAIKGANTLAVHALEALQSCQVRLEPLGFDQ
ncbi:hypothetical protein D3C79_618680 [compost metagenome]